MDIYLKQVRSQLRLCEMILEERLKWAEKYPQGWVLRGNWILHTNSMLVLVRELQKVAGHDPQDWYKEDAAAPF